MSNINSRMGAAEIIERLNQAKSTLDVSDSRINHLVSIMDELIDRLNCKEKNDTLYILIKPKAQISHLKWMTEKKFQDAVNSSQRDFSWRAIPWTNERAQKKRQTNL